MSLIWAAACAIISPMEKVRMAVVGCGVLGTRHAEIYSKMPDVELVGVVDTHGEKASKVAAACGTRVFENTAALKGHIDAASVCTPAHTHHEVAKPLLGAGTHLLIEKPITTRLDHADELLRLATDGRLVLQTGHVERFNPAVRMIKGLVKDPRFIECDRIGPYDPRIQDVGVVLDLMIHDIDIVLYLVGSSVTSVDTVGMSMHSANEDFANCRLTFENGTVANLTASRMARNRMRKIRVFQDNAYLSLDYFRQEAVVLTKDSGEPAYRTIEIEKSQPLQDELADFVSCVRTKDRPLVSGEAGRAALAVALQVLDQIHLQHH